MLNGLRQAEPGSVYASFMEMIKTRITPNRDINFMEDLGKTETLFRLKASLRQVVESDSPEWFTEEKETLYSETGRILQ